MATKEQMDSVGRIMRLAMKISIQGKYHVFASYSGHIDKFEVYAYPATHDYNSDAVYVDGLASQEHWIGLPYEDGQLAALEAILIPMLETDSDGIPV